jgi:hypothetical protein
MTCLVTKEPFAQLVTKTGKREERKKKTAQDS